MLSFCEKIRKNACRLIIILYLCSANTKYEIKMSNLIKPEGYKALLDMRQTEMGIKMIKEFFQQNLSTELRLRRVTAPLFVLKGLGINDDLNGVERPVSFPIKDLGEAQAEVVHSLAKWKRLTLAEYEIEPAYGVYTDMNAIRADEDYQGRPYPRLPREYRAPHLWCHLAYRVPGLRALSSAEAFPA